MRALRVERMFVTTLSLLALLAGGAFAQVTTIRISDRVEVEDVMRLGMHLTGNNWYDSPLKKMRVEANFEGTLFRQIHPVQVVDGDTVVGHTAREDWLEQLSGGSYTVLSGPDQWTTGRIEKIVEDKDYEGRKGRGRMRFELDREVQWHPEENGILVTAPKLDRGVVQGHSDEGGNELVHGDVRPGGFGRSCLNLKGSGGGGRVYFPALDSSVAATNGTWKVRFWAKRRTGDPVLSVGIQRVGSPQTLRPGARWKEHELTFDIRETPEPDSVFVEFNAPDGDVLIDDVQVWQEGDINPTPFRDAAVELLKEHNPGVVRLLNNDGNTVRNILRSPLGSYAARGVTYGSIKTRSIGLHEFYQLCAELGCDAWANLPGTLTPQDIQDYMEFIGAPPDVGMGRVRAELGQERPWTEVLDHIYVQFGNELVTFPGTGYAGPGYWKSLTEHGKTSPHYRDNVLFVVNHQPEARRNVERTPNADRLAISNYLIKRLNKDDVREALDTDEELFRYVFAWPYWRWTVRATANKWRYGPVMRDLGIEGAVYEGGNYHLTFGDAPSDVRNKIVTSIGGQVSCVNSMLFILKEYGVRAQNQFNLAQFSFTGGGSFGSGIRVRLWGQVTNMRPENRRLRPGFLGSMLANKVVGGDLMETLHTGDDPKFDSPPMFEIDGQENRAMSDVPTLYSYAFKEGSRRGLVVCSLDVSQERPVRVQFDGEVAGAEATRWLLTADDITANNEPEHEPQVHVRRSTVKGFRAGYQFDMPPYSLIAFEWQSP